MLEGSCVAPPAVMCMLPFRGTALLHECFYYLKDWALMHIRTETGNMNSKIFFPIETFKFWWDFENRSLVFFSISFFFFYILPHLPLSASTVWRFAITNSTYRCHQFNNDSGTSDATGMISMHFIKINSQLFFFLPSLGNTLLSPKLKTANLS